MSSRKRLDLDERRAQLLDLARSAFASKSYDDVSVDELAQLAGVSKGLIYHYFPSKRDLYVATVREMAQELKEAIEPQPGLTPREQLFRSLDAYIAFAASNAEYFLSFVRSGIGRDREVSEIRDETRQQAVNFLASYGQHFPLTPTQRVLLWGWAGFVESVTVAWLREQDAVERKQLARLLSKIFGQTLKTSLSQSQADQSESVAPPPPAVEPGSESA